MVPLRRKVNHIDPFGQSSPRFAQSSLRVIYELRCRTGNGVLTNVLWWLKSPLQVYRIGSSYACHKRLGGSPAPEHPSRRELLPGAFARFSLFDTLKQRASPRDLETGRAKVAKRQASARRGSRRAVSSCNDVLSQTSRRVGFFTVSGVRLDRLARSNRGASCLQRAARREPRPAHRPQSALSPILLFRHPQQASEERGSMKSSRSFPFSTRYQMRTVSPSSTRARPHSRRPNRIYHRYLPRL